MIETIDEFSRRLEQLDPDDAGFAVETHDVIKELSPSVAENVYTAIFLYFEAHPEADCGSPGALVHHIEKYYPNYVDALIQSVNRQPTFYGVWMINRILNSSVKSGLRQRLFESIVRASNDPLAAPHVREMARDDVERHQDRL